MINATRRFSRRKLFSETLETRRVMAATPIISEFLASNSGGLEDVDGDSSDWIEIYNPTSETFSLDGWGLTDDADEPDKWTFPAVDLEAGESIVVFASGKDRAVASEQLHTNFGLSSSGEYLALVQPDQTIATEFAPEYPPQSNNLSYGFEFQTDTLVELGATASYLIPNASIGNAWQSVGFNDSGWNSGNTGIGFGVATPGFDVRYVKAQPASGYNGRLDNITEAETLLATPAYQASVATDQVSVINFLNTGLGGNFGNDLTFPSLTIGQDVDHFAIEATSIIEIPSAGPWSFGVNSDDGFRLTLSKDGVDYQSEWPGTRGDEDSIETFNLPTAGEYSLRLVFFDAAFGGSVELFAAPGNQPSFNNSFELVGDVASGGLTSLAGLPLDQPGLVQTDVESTMQGANASAFMRIPFNVNDRNDIDTVLLNMRYDDGFVAYINGVEAARRNAPTSLAFNSSATADRRASDVLSLEPISISSDSLDAIVTGENVLAIQGLNSAAGDSSFLIAPELISQSVLDSSPTFFATPTPGTANVDPVLGLVDRVEVSLPAGFYQSPQTVALSTPTPGATIRFTTDGSEPSATNGTLYSGPIPITSTTTLRAIGTKQDFFSRPSVTRTYLFLDDVLTQSNDGSTPANWPTDYGNRAMDFGIDPEVVNIETAARVKAALLDLPTISLTTDLDNLFNPNTGIYANPQQDGRDWERPASAEWINPDGSEGFQVNAGLRIRGGFSRNLDNPKHSFKLFFRGVYGDSTLEYPVHGDRGVSEFEKLDLRSPQNYAWSREGNPSNQFVTEALARTTQLELGQPSTRSKWVHLYLNGQYWGMYQTQERADANFAESYFGGDANNYDVLKPEGGSGLAVEATDGNRDAFDELWQQAAARDGNTNLPAFVDNANYLKAQGKNPDGSDNLNYPVLLDVENLIVYMVDTLRSGNLDAPISNFLGNERPNNFFAIRDRTAREGFKYFQHDAEHAWRDPNIDRNGPFNSPNFDNDSTYFNPQWLHQQLMANDEYRIAFADKIQETFFNNGLLTVEATQARIDQATSEIDLAVIANSARWGDAQSGTPRLRSDFLNAINDLRNSFIPTRVPVALEQFKNTELRLKDGAGNYTVQVPAPLFPDTDAPEFFVAGTSQLGGVVEPGTAVTLVGSEGTIHYTTDGSDPRDFGGGINPAAASVATGTTNLTLIEQGSVWKYDDTGSNLGTTWRSTGFNDSLWQSGPAPLGYGNDGEVTTVGFGGDANNKHITTYFRNQFTVPAGQIASATLDLKFDDGVAVYINGVEVTEARRNLPANPAFDQFATGVITDASFTSFAIPSSYLVPGNNTIAVEIHQVSRTSSDIGFDVSLEVATFSDAAASSINVDQATQIKARVLTNDGTWSALSDATFDVNATVPADASNLRLTEIHYNPVEGNNAEFLELQNISDFTIDLGGVTLTDGPSTDFVIPSGVSLGPGKFALIVSNEAAFRSANSTDIGDKVIGQWATGALSNGGENIRLEDASGNEIVDVDYDDRDLWSVTADGNGASLELVDPVNTPDNLASKPYSWRGSVTVGGTPGAARVAPQGIVINEILAHTDLPQFDSIEVFNPTNTAIDIGGWYLSDDVEAPLKYRIPLNTSIPAGGYLSFNETDFNTGAIPFLLNSGGEQAVLSQSDDGITVSRFEDAIEFAATFNGQSLGRIPGNLPRLAPLASESIGRINGGFAWSDITISEVHYHPTDPDITGVSDRDLEFVELYNPGSDDVLLTDWRLAVTSDTDLNFVFDGQSIPAGETLVAVTFDPVINTGLRDAFRSHYGIDQNVVLVGPLGDTLNNSHGIVKLLRPDTPGLDETEIPNVLSDEVFYDDQLPWAIAADGDGQSLNRIASTTLGNFSDSWTGSSPTPGQYQGSGNISSIVINNDRQTRSEITSITVSFDGSVDATVDDFQITNLDTNEVVTGVQLNIAGQVATLTFTGGDSVAGDLSDNNEPTLSNGNYELKFKRSGSFASVAPEPIDNFFRKYGDASGDDLVGLTDFANFRSSFGKKINEDGFNSSLDSDRDGLVSLTDFAAFRQAFGR
ncbi:CotH protein [Rubripirellula obstinata]|uniref:CotH protein n=1 Tax=Rubripirellula obstinata TaxID=406547 RepID=A0A5B1CL11_9BACT|nr:lamin tail domain-containing protein [Rubripirellula obstinata]KAA1261226.1 CotH protein [Rubripirellula obstinata]